MLPGATPVTSAAPTVTPSSALAPPLVLLPPPVPSGTESDKVLKDAEVGKYP